MAEISPSASIVGSIGPVVPAEEVRGRSYSLSTPSTSEPVTSPRQVPVVEPKRLFSGIIKLPPLLDSILPSVKAPLIPIAKVLSIALDFKGKFLSLDINEKKLEKLHRLFIEGYKTLSQRYPKAFDRVEREQKINTVFDSFIQLLKDEFGGSLELLEKDVQELFDMTYQLIKPPASALLKLTKDPDELEGKFLTSPLPPSFVAATETLGKILAIGTGIGVIFDLTSLVSSTIQIGTGAGKIHSGLRYIKEAQYEVGKSKFWAAKIQYGKDKVSDGVRLIGTGGAWLGASIASLARGAASLAIHIQPAVTAGASIAVAAGGLILAPIALTLSSIGIVKNIKQLRHAHGRLLVVRSEIERTRQELRNLVEIKRTRPLTPAEENKYLELTERNEFLTFAERRLKSQKVKEILGLVQNSFVIVASISGALSLVSGQAGAAFFVVSIVSFALGIGGNLIGRGILAAVNKYQKEESIKGHEEALLKAQTPLNVSGPRKYVASQDLQIQGELDLIDHPRYLSNKEAFQKYAEKFHQDIENEVSYTGSGNPADWSNNELALQILNPHDGFKAEVEKDANGNLSVKYTPSKKTLAKYKSTPFTQQKIFAIETKKFATKIAFESYEKKVDKQNRLRNQGVSQEIIDKVKPDKRTWKKAFGG